MNYTGFNMSSIKTANRSSVLYLLNSGEQLSRKDIAEKLGLTPAAVSKICAELIAEGAIAECGISGEGGGAGRKKIILSLNSESLFVLALNIDKKGFYAALCTIDGKEQIGERFFFENDCSPEECLRFAGKKCRELIEKSKISKEKIIGIGVGIVGGADSENGVTAGNYGIWKPGVPVRRILEEELSMPVAVENNVKSFAIASLIFDRRDTDESILFVKWGPGVGSAIVVGSAVLGKADSDSSEIGHYIAAPDGEECRCKRRGCLETVISSDAIVERVERKYGKKNLTALSERSDINGNKTEILDILSAFSKEQTVREEIESCTKLLSKAVTNAAAVIAPDVVITFGYMFTDEVFKVFEAECRALYPGFKNGCFRLSRLDKKHNYIGPAAVAAKSFFFERK